MSEEEKKAIEELKSWRKYIIEHRERVNKANDIEFYLRTALNLIEKQNNRLEQLEKENKIAKPVLEQNARLFNEKERLKNQITKIQEQNKEIVNKNYISKSIILSKIEELDKNGYWEYLEKRDLEKTINILEELLEEQNENRN